MRMDCGQQVEAEVDPDRHAMEPSGLFQEFFETREIDRLVEEDAHDHLEQ
jgi:hypothetical protein